MESRFGECTIRLSGTESSTTLPSGTLTRAPQHTEDSIPEFSPYKALAAVAGVQYSHSSQPQVGRPAADHQCEYGGYGLGVIGNTTIAIGCQKVVVWELPAGDCVPSTWIWVDLEDSSRTMNLSYLLGLDSAVGASISLDSRHIVIVAEYWFRGFYSFLHILSASTGEHLGKWSALGSTPRFTQVRCVDDYKVKVWGVGSGREVLKRTGRFDVEPIL